MLQPDLVPLHVVLVAEVLGVDLVAELVVMAAKLPHFLLESLWLAFSFGGATDIFLGRQKSRAVPERRLWLFSHSVIGGASRLS